MADRTTFDDHREATKQLGLPSKHEELFGSEETKEHEGFTQLCAVLFQCGLVATAAFATTQSTDAALTAFS